MKLNYSYHPIIHKSTGLKFSLCIEQEMDPDVSSRLANNAEAKLNEYEDNVITTLWDGLKHLTPFALFYKYGDNRQMRCYRDVTDLLTGDHLNGLHITLSTNKIPASMVVIKTGKGNHAGKRHSKETRAKMSATHKGKKLSDDTKAMMSAVKKGIYIRSGKDVRDKTLYEGYMRGVGVEYLARTYKLSIISIRKIIGRLRKLSLTDDK